MAIVYVGPIVLEVDGVDYDIESLEPTDKTGRKAVKTMNKTGKPKGYANGVKEFPIKFTAPIPETGEPDWWNMTNAKITIDPLDSGAKRVTYSGVCVEEVGTKYTVDSEAKRDLTAFALDRKEE